MQRLQCYGTYIHQVSGVRNVRRVCSLAIQATQSMLRSFPADPFAAEKMAWFLYKANDIPRCALKPAAWHAGHALEPAAAAYACSACTRLCCCRLRMPHEPARHRPEDSRTLAHHDAACACATCAWHPGHGMRAARPLPVHCKSPSHPSPTSACRLMVAVNSNAYLCALCSLCHSVGCIRKSAYSAQPHTATTATTSVAACHAVPAGA
jgi:hypothetical protein